MKTPSVIAAARRACGRSVVLVLCLCADVARAGNTPSFAVPGAQSATTPVVGTLRVTLAMMLVLAAVLAAAWLTRRMRGMAGASSAGIEVLAQVSLGTRERVVLLRAGGRQVLVGVAPGSVRTLHVLEANEDGAPDIPAVAAVASSAARPTFKSLLLKSLGR